MDWKKLHHLPLGGWKEEEKEEEIEQPIIERGVKMVFKQWEIEVQAPSRGFHLITADILGKIDIRDIEVGLLNLFLLHTSASLTINENASPAVRRDMERISSQLIPDGGGYHHYFEGPDDMPAHFKTSLFGVSLTIPIRKGRIVLGNWQGIYLNEHRDTPLPRKIIATAFGEPKWGD